MAAEKLRPDERSVRLALAEFSAEAVMTAAAAGGFYGLAREELERGRFTRVPGLAVSGGDIKALGVEGEEISGLLRALSALVTLGELENERDALLGYVKNQIVT